MRDSFIPVFPSSEYSISLFVYFKPSELKGVNLVDNLLNPLRSFLEGAEVELSAAHIFFQTLSLLLESFEL